MFLGLDFRPGNFDTQAGNNARPFSLAGLSVEPHGAVDELLDDHVAGDARFLVGEGEDETYFVEGNGLGDGADGALVWVFGTDHVLGDFYVHLDAFESVLRPFRFAGEIGSYIPCSILQPYTPPGYGLLK